ncbi:hypothetical protein O1D97_07415 [Marinomonas sp. 15G1-11]|uniref:Uncharacterized protein n=1 Tax=Marinomonas phaeophyticola TaxID=3004091 RepID=A0ABT4JTB0_9GAMM|nr:hypothetical protein [Marinomonas sp. 15G1-11]MCZ2721486.1 hypothetical protein [Marinomonas sp. 15G1-11]
MFSKKHHSPFSIHTFSGYGVVAGCGLFLLSLIPYFEWLYGFSALCYWGVFIVSWKRLNQRNKSQIRLLIGAGGVALIYHLYLAESIDLSSLLEGNLGIVAMLTGVSLLALLPDTAKQSPPVLGIKGALYTWLSVHLLGAVINMSATFFVGDKLQRPTGKMTMPQYSMLVRALTSAGLWSPFFASVAVALSIAPDAEFHNLAMIGIPMAICSCLLSLWELKRRDHLASFSGFPIAVNSLFFPVMLALLVIVFHYFIMTQTPILSIVTLLSPLSVVIYLTLKTGGNHTRSRIRDHIHIRLPNMANEIALFLSAGFLSKAISLALMSTFGNEWSLFTSFGFSEALICFIGICGISLLGLHPIVGISLMSSFVPAGSADNTLLAFVSLSSWAVGTAISPLSGINLSISGKYGVDNFQLARSNWRYGGMMAVVVAFGMMGLVLF